MNEVTNTIATEGVYRIPAKNIGMLQAKLAKLAKRAVKLGKLPAELHIGDKVQDTRKVFDPDLGRDVTRVREFYLCTVTGERPVLAGYSFIATVQHAGEAGNILRSMPGETVPSEFRTTDPERCDHCHQKRRRTDTYIVRHDASGKHAQVGSSCLQDFLGGVSPAEVVAFAQYLLSANETLSLYAADNFEHAELAYSIEDFLAYTAAVIQTKGWLSRTAARNSGAEATADAVWHAINPPTKSCKTERYTCALHYDLQITDSQRKLASDALDWGRAKFISQSELSDYEHNLGVVIKCEAVTLRQAGLAASLIAVYQRELGKLVAAEQRKRLGENSQHVGKIGERLSLGPCVLVGRREFDGRYGATTLLTFTDQAGNIIKWFASGNYEVEIGKTYSVTATVKAHGEYQGVLETTITRAKLGE